MAEKAKKNWEPKIIYVYLVCLLAMSVILFNSVFLPHKITDLVFNTTAYYLSSDTKIDRLQDYTHKIKNNQISQISFEEYNKILDEKKVKNLQDRKTEKIKDLINSLLAIGIAALFFQWHWVMRKD